MCFSSSISMQHTKVISVPTKMYDGSSSALKKRKVTSIISEDKRADTDTGNVSRSAPGLTSLMLMMLGDKHREESNAPAVDTSSDAINLDNNIDNNEDWFMDGKKDSFVLTERRLGKARNRQVQTTSSKRNADWIIQHPSSGSSTPKSESE